MVIKYNTIDNWIGIKINIIMIFYPSNNLATILYNPRMLDNLVQAEAETSVGAEQLV